MYRPALKQVEIPIKAPGSAYIGFRFGIWQCLESGKIRQDSHRVDELTETPPLTRDPDYTLSGYTSEILDRYIDCIENRTLAEIAAAHVVGVYDDETQNDAEINEDEGLIESRNLERDAEKLRIQDSLNRLFADIALLWLEGMKFGPRNDDGERIDDGSATLTNFDNSRFKLIKAQNFLQDMMAGLRDDVAEAPRFRGRYLLHDFGEEWG